MILAYEKLKADVEQFEIKRDQLRTSREKAATAAEVARQQYADAVKHAVADPAKAVDAATVRVNIDIAEERLRQAEEALYNYPSAPPGVELACSKVCDAIRNAKADGSLFEELQPLLNELDELRRKYLDKLRVLLVEKEKLNTELSGVQSDARAIQGQYADMVNVQPVYVATSDFSKWIWIGPDYQNVFSDVERSLQIPLPQPVRQGNIRTIPTSPQHTYGQRETPLYQK